MTFGHPCPVSDLFGHAGRELLDRLQIPDPWRRNVDASLELIDDLELQIAQLTVELRRQGADHRYIPLERSIWATLGPRLAAQALLGALVALGVAGQLALATNRRIGQPDRLGELA